MTLNQKLWLKEVKRINRFMKRAAKRGYDFSKFVMPQKPKRITSQAIQRIKAITPSVLYKSATYKTPTGETMTGEKRRAQERRVAAQKARYTRELKKRIDEYIKQNAKEVKEDEIIDGGKDSLKLSDNITFQDGMAIDSVTGEILFEYDADGIVFSADDAITNFKKRLIDIPTRGAPYKTTMEKWLERLIKLLGKEKVAMSLERMAHLDKLIQRATRYENDFLFFVWEHMNNFIQQGWMEREIAETIMEEFTDNQDEFFSDGVVI